MLLPQAWNHCCHWVVTTTSWRESRNKTLTNHFLKGFQAGNPSESQRAIIAYLDALRYKQNELCGLRDGLLRAYDNHLQENALNLDEHTRRQIQDEKESVKALLAQVEKELEDQFQDWRDELRAIGGTYVEPEIDEKSSIGATIKSLLTPRFRRRNRRITSFATRTDKPGPLVAKKSDSAKRKNRH